MGAPMRAILGIVMIYGAVNLVVWVVSMVALALGYSVEAAALQGLLPLFHGQSMP